MKCNKLGLSFFLVGILFAYYPTFSSSFRLMQNDPGDSLFNNYILEHGYRWVTQQPLHTAFWDAPFFFPERNVTAYSDILLGAAPIYWLWRVFNFLPDTAFQLWLIAVAG